MSKDKYICFKQSLGDFPLTVKLGEKTPNWGLSRWGGQGLRFVPPDDEGFAIKGNKQQLVYKGRRRSHRFTILGDKSFEYDCILENEPESNVVTLLLEGAEKYNFFRQPDFVQDPFLKGSYAVYKKETLIGEGTGKLCHIHRPEIIDARGRRCWGDLSIKVNRLCITIPEKWLGEAEYPVIVDPVIGTTTVGSQTKWEPFPKELTTLMFEGELPVNRFLVPETINGICTAYFYTNEDEPEAGGRPVLYSDNSNEPLNRKSMQENFIDFRVTGGKPAGWRSGTFMSNSSIASGSYIWFGCFTDFFWFPRFDYGAKLYSAWWYDEGDDIPEIHPKTMSGWYKDIKLSMYFDYSSAQNYVRTLTQGVTLNDSKKLTAGYKRESLETVQGIAAAGSLAAYFRECVMDVSCCMKLSRIQTFIRMMLENLKINDGIKIKRELKRKCKDGAVIGSEAWRSRGFFRGLIESLSIADNFSFPILFLRSITETEGVSDTVQQWGAFVRGLYVEAGCLAEASHKGEYCRVEKDAVQAKGTVFRGLLIFVRILTTSFVRDFVLRRFLIAREEIVLKSCITREITLESRIN